MSFGREQSGRSALVNGRPAFDNFAISPEHAQANPLFVDEIAHFVEPAKRDQADDIVARPVDFIPGVGRFADIHIQGEKARILVKVLSG